MSCLLDSWQSLLSNNATRCANFLSLGSNSFFQENQSLNLGAIVRKSIVDKGRPFIPSQVFADLCGFSGKLKVKTVSACHCCDRIRSRAQPLGRSCFSHRSHCEDVSLLLAVSLVLADSWMSRTQISKTLSKLRWPTWRTSVLEISSIHTWISA